MNGVGNDWFIRSAKDADLGRPDRRLSVAEPELFICPECREWTDDSDPCCGVGGKYDHDEVER